MLSTIILSILFDKHSRCFLRARSLVLTHFFFLNRQVRILLFLMLTEI